MKENFNPNIIDTLVRMSHTIKEDNDYIDNESYKAFEEVCEKENENINIYTESFHGYHKSIKSRIIRKSINYILGDLKGIEQKHIDDVLEMEHEDKLSKKINLPRGIVVYRNKSYISITNKEIIHEDIEYCYNVPTNGYIKIKELNMVVESKILNIDKIKNMKSDKNAKLFDVDKVEGGIVIRNRKP
ncbi:MAG TPA: tRNA(Ile)-lysidine synthetase, partial [Peptostreptococcaceae bacterium]|nr:tRNA(Ile)-lysidine synthetase [Peptostreptococcaceae bacterium]